MARPEPALRVNPVSPFTRVRQWRMHGLALLACVLAGASAEGRPPSEGAEQRFLEGADHPVPGGDDPETEEAP